MNKTTTNVTARYARRRRTVLGVGAGAGAVVIGLASAAYACTLLIGTFTVCRPPSTTFNALTCGQRVDTGLQVGAVTFDDGGSGISIVGSGFTSSPDVYSITFAPSVVGNCHVHNPSAGSVSLIGTDGSGNPNTISGPTFDLGNGTGTYPTVTTPAVSPGAYSVCVQQETARVTGSAVLGLVSLL